MSEVRNPTMPGDSSRDGFPEPTLLPHLAAALPAPALPWLLTVADLTTVQTSICPPMPRLLETTCAIVAKRIDRDSEPQASRALLADSTAFYSHLPPSLLDLATRILTLPGDRWAAEPRAERICRLAARFPNHDGGVLVDLASAALCDMPTGRGLQNAGAWLLPLTTGTERQAIINEWMEATWFELAPLTAMFAAANETEREALTTKLLTMLDSPGATVAALATLWPNLANGTRSNVRDVLTNAWRSVRPAQPAWWLALVWSRLQALNVDLALDTDAALDYDPIDSHWRDWLKGLGPLPPKQSPSVESGAHPDNVWVDVMRAHPGANSAQRDQDQPAISTDAAGEILDQIMARWGGMESAAAPGDDGGAVEPDSPVSVRLPAPGRPQDVPSRPKSHGGGLLERVSGRIGGMLGSIFGPRDPAHRPVEATRGPTSQPGGGLTTDQSPLRDLQADVLLADSDSDTTRQLTRAFVAGRTHWVDLSVGFDASLRVDGGFVEPQFADDQDFETLDLRLIHGDTSSGGSVQLPKSILQSSSVWRANLSVPQDSSNVEATVVVLHKGRVLQAARLFGAVQPTLDAAMTADSKIGFEVSENIHQITDLHHRQPFDASVLSDGKTSAAFAGADVEMRDLRGVDETIRKLTDKLFKTAEAVAMAGGGGDPRQFENLLVFLATHGKLLHSVLIRQLMPELDQAKRIQIVSTNPSAILPLEFVYAGPSPTHTATLCDGWQDALKDGHCPSCQQQPGQRRSPTICPLHFWALSKIIERHAPVKPRAGTSDFAVSGALAGRRDALRPLQSALFAASDNVPETLVEATLAALKSVVADCEDAQTWADWADAVKTNSPSLLVSMPHNALDPVLEISTLEIGRGSELRAGEVSRDLVCGKDSKVPPVVLLLGCQTAHGGPQPFHTFVGEFRNNGAAIVIGTLATVLGEHAAPIVQAIIRELAQPVDPDQKTFGELLLKIRRQMFARGILIALAVAAFGDADWELANGD